MATLAQSAFIAALTADDQLSPAERKRHADQSQRDERQRAKDDRYEAFMLATAAFHRAMAANIAACTARILRYHDVRERNAAEIVAVAAFIEAADRLMRLPVLGKDDEKDRATRIRQWGKCATTIETAPMYQRAKSRWQKQLLSSIAQGGR